MSFKNKKIKQRHIQTSISENNTVSFYNPTIEDWQAEEKVAHHFGHVPVQIIHQVNKMYLNANAIVNIVPNENF